MKNIILAITTSSTLAVTANAAIILYTTDFGGLSSTNLNGVAVDSSGATGAEHTQYGTTAGETWTAGTAYKADGSTTGVSAGSLAFTPQDGYVYTLSMTVDFAPPSGSYYAAGFMESDSAQLMGNDGVVWGLTRPGLTATGADQVAHYNAGGGTGNVGQGTLDTSSPSTIILELDTTNALDWVATWNFSTTAGGVTELHSQSVDGSNIAGVGIGNFNLSSGTYESFELSVEAVQAVPEPSSTALLGLGGLALILRRRR